MHQALVARTYLDRLHPAAFVDRDGQNEIPIRVDAARRQLKRLRRFDDQVRLSQLPSFHELRLSWQVRWTALQHTLLNPLLNERDLLAAETALVGELQRLRFRQPRRHEARLRDRSDLVPVFLDVFIGQQRERAGLTRPMTGCAVMKDDGSNIAIERDLVAAAPTS